MTFKATTVDYCPEGIYNSKGYGNVEESVQILLDRCDWANQYAGRINLSIRFLLIAFICTLLVLVVIQNKIPEISVYIQGVLLMWLFLRGSHYFFRHHCDKFSNYAIDRNIRLIRKKLNIKGGGKLHPRTCKFKSASSCWNFTYKETL